LQQKPVALTGDWSAGFTLTDDDPIWDENHKVCTQGDQMGRIFAPWVIVYSGQFFL
jgi:hypothetical protein